MEKEIADQIAKIETTGEKAGRDAEVVRAQAMIANDLARAIGELSIYLNTYLGNLTLAVGELTTAFDGAAKAADRSSDRMARLTKVLVGATIAYTFLTGLGLIVAVWGAPKIACVTASAP